MTGAVLPPVALYTAAWVVGSLTQRMWLSATVAGLLLLVQLAVLVACMRQRRRYKADAACLARAEYEHAALCRGDIAVGTYGAFQPPRI